MKNVIGPYTFELHNTMVYVRETSTGNLLKAIDYKATEAMDKFNAICAHWEAKTKTKVA
jgi:hypothetical protein